MDATPELTHPTQPPALPDSGPGGAPAPSAAPTLGYAPLTPDLNRPGPLRLPWGLFAGLLLMFIGLVCVVGWIKLEGAGQSLNATLLLFASPFVVAIGPRFVRAAYAVLIGKPPPKQHPLDRPAR